MLTSEIITEATIFDERTLKNTAWESPRQLITWLKENGFKKLGGGVFSVAYAKPGHKRIVKVSKRQDDCWIKFAQWAMTKTNNKHLPKIPWIKRYIGKRKGQPSEFFVTIIERLSPLSDEVIEKTTDPGVLIGLRQYADLDSDTVQMVDTAMRSQINMDDFKTYNDILKKYKNHPFIRALQSIVTLSGECWTDLHAGNLMVRNDGTIVITDPIAGDFT